MHFDLCNSQIDLGPWDYSDWQLVISRGCFQEVSCDGTLFIPWLVTLLIGGFYGVSCDGTVQCSAWSRGCYISPRIIWDPGIILGFSLFSLINFGVVLALLKDKQSLVEDYNVLFFTGQGITNH